MENKEKQKNSRKDLVKKADHLYYPESKIRNRQSLQEENPGVDRKQDKFLSNRYKLTDFTLDELDIPGSNDAHPEVFKTF